MRFKILLTSLVLVLLLPVSASIALGQSVIIDPSPYNLTTPGWAVAISLHREISASANIIGAYSGGGSGYFYMLNAFVVLNPSNSYLTDLSKVTSVTVNRLPPGAPQDPNELTLYPFYPNFQWLDATGSLFSRQFRMEGWEYGVDWEFVMTYIGTDGNTHTQSTILKNSLLPSPSPVPLPIHAVRFQQIGSGLTVTWPAAGDPTITNSPFTYRVRVMDVNTGNFVAEIRGLGDPACPTGTVWCFDQDSGGSYNPLNNLVAFPIPNQFRGLPYALRLEYEFGHRSSGSPYFGGPIFSRSEVYVVAPK
jgi:hypothetical protein